MKLFKMTTCKDVYHNHKSDRPRGILQRIGIFCHLFICKNCQRLEDNYKFIEEKMKKSMKTKQDTSKPEMIEKLKREIKSKL